MEWIDMVKMRDVQMHKVEDVPDHILQEITDLSTKMLTTITPLCEDISPNLILGAINFLHASLIKNMIADDLDQQKKAVLMTARALICNLAMINNIDVKEWMGEPDK
jgi:hypothetical protein